jgi:hypothetical protein
MMKIDLDLMEGKILAHRGRMGGKTMRALSSVISETLEVVENSDDKTTSLSSIVIKTSEVEEKT